MASLRSAAEPFRKMINEIVVNNFFHLFDFHRSLKIKWKICSKAGHTFNYTDNRKQNISSKALWPPFSLVHWVVQNLHYSLQRDRNFSSQLHN